MISKTLHHYIWLVETLQKLKRATYEEINERWKEDMLNNGRDLPKSTLSNYIKAIPEVLGVSIKCDRYDHYRYYLDHPIFLEKSTNKWLINSFTQSKYLFSARSMGDRILFEDVPKTEYLQSAIEAMQKNRVIEFDYQQFAGHRETCHIEPYAMKVYRQRWYIVGRIIESGGIRCIAIDRILDFKLTETKFKVPESFKAKDYFKNVVGIYTNDDQKPQTVRIKVYGVAVEYLRSRPLHETQREVSTKHLESSTFEYKLCITPDLSTELLSMGEKVEVLEPAELREEMKKRISLLFNLYK